MRALYGLGQFAVPLLPDAIFIMLISVFIGAPALTGDSSSAHGATTSAFVPWRIPCASTQFHNVSPARFSLQGALILSQALRLFSKKKCVTSIFSYLIVSLSDNAVVAHSSAATQGRSTEADAIVVLFIHVGKEGQECAGQVRSGPI